MSPRILIVEDNEDLAQNVAELFEEDGASVVFTTDAATALEHAKARGFDLAIVDVRLPGASGVDLVPSLKELSPDGEVILMTGNATLDTAIAAVRHGVFAYLLKPFAPGDMLALGGRALAQVSLRREREGLARELARSEALYRAVLEAVEAVIVLVSDDGTVEFLNRFASLVTGRSASDAVGTAFRDWAMSDADKLAYDEMLAQARTGQSVRERQLSMRGAGGARRIVRWSVTRLDYDGAVPGVILARGIDVTERLDLERRTADSEAMAAMGRLTAGLAHEIRNPLNAAKLQLEVLSRQARRMTDGELGGRILERVDVVQGELARLSSMLDDFLTLARPRALESQPFDVGELIEEVVSYQAPAAEHVGVKLVHDVTMTASQAAADRARIKQVLLNLVSNAMEALRDQRGGEVRVSARDVDGQRVEVTVADNGPGIPGEVLERVFQPFVTTKEAGTGLGLTIVKKLVELHGGEVELSSDEGSGAIARFTLPRA